MLRKVFLSIASTLLALLAVEVSLRVVGCGEAVGVDDLAIAWSPYAPYREHADPEILLTLEPHYVGSQRYIRSGDGAVMREVEVHTDADGLRVEPGSPRTGKPTVLVVGDSLVFGQGVAEGDTFVAVAEAHLGDRRFRNAGVPGWNSQQEIRWLQREGLSLTPSAVLLCFYINDLASKPFFVTSRQMPHLFLSTPDWAWRESGWVGASRVFTVFKRAVERRRIAAEFAADHADYIDTITSGDPESDARRWLGELASTCTLNSLPCGVAVLPPLDLADVEQARDVLDTVAGVAGEVGLGVIRLDHVLDGMHPAERRVTPGDEHPSERAHLLLGEALANALRSNPLEVPG